MVFCPECAKKKGHKKVEMGEGMILFTCPKCGFQTRGINLT